VGPLLHPLSLRVAEPAGSEPVIVACAAAARSVQPGCDAPHNAHGCHRTSDWRRGHPQEFESRVSVTWPGPGAGRACNAIHCGSGEIPSERTKARRTDVGP
jgi:hypothetical protein